MANLLAGGASNRWHRRLASARRPVRCWAWRAAPPEIGVLLFRGGRHAARKYRRIDAADIVSSVLLTATYHLRRLISPLAGARPSSAERHAYVLQGAARAAEMHVIWRGRAAVLR